MPGCRNRVVLNRSRNVLTDGRRAQTDSCRSGSGDRPSPDRAGRHGQNRRSDGPTQPVPPTLAPRNAARLGVGGRCQQHDGHVSAIDRRLRLYECAAWCFVQTMGTDRSYSQRVVNGSSGSRSRPGPSARPPDDARASTATPLPRLQSLGRSDGSKTTTQALRRCCAGPAVTWPERLASQLIETASIPAMRKSVTTSTAATRSIWPASTASATATRKPRAPAVTTIRVSDAVP